MARLFDDGASQYLVVASSPISGVPAAMSCWARSDDDTASQCPLCISRIDGSDRDNLRIHFVGTSAGDPIWAYARDASQVFAATSSGYTANTWHHVCALFIADDRAVLIDGGSKGTESTSLTLEALDRVVIGAYIYKIAVIGSYFSGAIAEVGLWDLSAWPGATAADKAAEFERVAVPALALRYAPSFFPLGLVAYWALFRDEDQDIVGGYDLTPINSPTIAVHPPMIYPSPPYIAHISAAAPPPTIIPVVMHHYRSRRVN